ncbi:hypothetical protein D3C71_1749880 [compost metagenome]
MTDVVMVLPVHGIHQVLVHEQHGGHVVFDQCVPGIVNLGTRADVFTHHWIRTNVVTHEFRPCPTVQQAPALAQGITGSAAFSFGFERSLTGLTNHLMQQWGTYSQAKGCDHVTDF